MREALAESPDDFRLVWRYVASVLSHHGASIEDQNAAMREVRRVAIVAESLTVSARAEKTAGVLLECLVLLRCSGARSQRSRAAGRVIELAMAFCDLHPSDANGYALFTISLGTAAIARVVELLTAEGRCWAHLLLHPLSCGDCVGPAVAPRTCHLGLLHCEACARRSQPAVASAGATTTAAGALIAEALPAAAEVSRLRLAGNAALEAPDLEESARLYEAAAAAAAAASRTSEIPCSLPPLAHAVHSNLSLVRLRQGRIDDALKAAQVAAEASPVPYWRGALRWELARDAHLIASASASASSRLDLSPDDVGSHLLQALSRAAVAQVTRGGGWGLGFYSIPHMCLPRSVRIQIIAEEQLSASLYLSGALGDASDLTSSSVTEACLPADLSSAKHSVPLLTFWSVTEAELASAWCRDHIRSFAGHVERLIPPLDRLSPVDGGQKNRAGAASPSSLPELLNRLCGAVARAAASVVALEDDGERASAGLQLRKHLLFVLASVSEDISAAIAAGKPAAQAEHAALVARGWALPVGGPLLRSAVAEGGSTLHGDSTIEPSGSAAAVAGAPMDPPVEAAAATDAAAWQCAGFGAYRSASPCLWPPLRMSTVLEALQCVVCFGTLYEPVTLPLCQHSLCRACAMRALDHKPECPMCRQDASAFLRACTYRYPVNLALLRVALSAAPAEMAERAALVASERAAAAELLPVFVCSLALPGQDAPLHIFEPRYRLMMRRAVEDGSRCFGMAAHTGVPPGYPDVGTRMRIRSLQLLPDGRSLVDCVGEQRFRVVERSMRDGYNVARVTWLEDADAGHELASLDASTRADWEHVRGFVNQLLTATPQNLGAPGPSWWAHAAHALGAGHGAPPEAAFGAAFQAGILVLASTISRIGRPPAAPEVDPQAWLWWLCNALPVGDGRKLEWLASPSWSSRVASVASTLRGLGTPLAFIQQVGAHVSARGLDACGVQ